MQNKIAWTLLASKNRTGRKMAELAKCFEEKKKKVDLSSGEAMSLMDDIERAKELGADFITYIDKEYPEELRNIASPSPYLFVKGNKKLLKHPVKVTIAGSRIATDYGMTVAANFAHELAGNNVCIVSGGAKGIDTAAIRGAMRVGMNVIVVLGSGIDVYYPPENKQLFKRVCEEGGVIVSEFGLGMGPLGQNFPVRNRIMTALGDSVVIVEAAERSGALISATHALEQGKTLFAVPQNIDSPNSVGVNALLRDGAQFALSGSDILYELMERMPDRFRKAQSFEGESEEKSEKVEEGAKNLSSMENAVVNALKSGKDTYEGILDFCGMEPNKLTSLLTIMEIKGIIRFAFGNRYKLND